MPTSICLSDFDDIFEYLQTCNDCTDQLTEIEWAIPESLLGIFWDDVFQRIIVFKWYLELNQEHAGPGDNPYPIHLDVTVFLESGGLSVIESIRPPFASINGDDGVDYLVKMMNAMKLDPEMSEEFKDHSLQPLIDYWTRDANDLLDEDGNVDPNKQLNEKRIPVFIRSANGYDYILSEKGIELFFPDRPLKDEDGDEEEVDKRFRKEIYFIYNYRQLGIDTLLIPPEPGTYGNAGPRVTLDPVTNDQHKSVIMVASDNNIEALLGQGCDFHVSEVPDELCGCCDEDNSSVLIDTILDQIKVLLDCPEIDCTEVPNDPMHKAYCALAAFLQLLRCQKGMSLTVYVQLLKRTRCWFLSGSVFRRVANEMPRLKARLWIEELSRDVDAGDPPTDPKRRYMNNGNLPGRTCRTMFEELMEISLKKCDRFYFKGWDYNNDLNQVRNINGAHVPEPLPGLIRDYRPNEIYIHNRGITLPAVGAGPTKKDIYQSWKNGVAANPTFTNSRKTS